MTINESNKTSQKALYLRPEAIEHFFADSAIKDWLGKINVETVNERDLHWPSVDRVVVLPYGGGYQYNEVSPRMAVLIAEALSLGLPVHTIRIEDTEIITIIDENGKSSDRVTSFSVGFEDKKSSSLPTIAIMSQKQVKDQEFEILASESLGRHDLGSKRTNIIVER